MERRGSVFNDLQLKTERERERVSEWEDREIIRKTEVKKRQRQTDRQTR